MATRLALMPARLSISHATCAGPTTEARAHSGGGDRRLIVQAGRGARSQWRCRRTGNAGAQAILGTLYLTGQDVTQDYAEAARWYRKASEQGNAVAQAALGIMYSTGQRVMQNYTEAARWRCRKAADQGNSDGQSNLGDKTTPAAELESIAAKSWKARNRENKTGACNHVCNTVASS